jgi:hypothetical protein
MKNLFILSLLIVGFHLSAQTYTSDFETFSLSPNSFYKDTNSTPFISGNATFQYQWTKGSFPYWSGGFSYTNKYDSSTAGYSNLYGVKAYKGFSGSSTYVIGQDKGMIKLNQPAGTITGMYLTNSTYAYKSIKYGDSFSKKFGGSTGNDPDFFKVVIRGYLNGALKSDSVEFYLADFRSSNNSLDYIIDSWTLVNTATLGKVDSIFFTMRSSDVGSFGINTPLFFGLDNLTVNYGSTVGLTENKESGFKIGPNPFHSFLKIVGSDIISDRVKIYSLSGTLVGEYNVVNEMISPEGLLKGVYLIELETGAGRSIKRVVKD